MFPLYLHTPIVGSFGRTKAPGVLVTFNQPKVSARMLRMMSTFGFYSGMQNVLISN
jgi:hypothetical protein